MNSFENIDWGGIALKAGAAILILLATWLIAKLVKSGIAKLATRVKALQRAGDDGQTLGASLGTIAALVIWLLGLVAVLQVFALDGVLAPITGLLDGVLGFLPNLIGAAFVFFIGFVIARIVAQLIETSLRTVNFGKLTGAASKGINAATDNATAGQQRPSNSQFQPSAAQHGGPSQPASGTPYQGPAAGASNPSGPQTGAQPQQSAQPQQGGHTQQFTTGQQPYTGPTQHQPGQQPQSGPHGPQTGQQPHTGQQPAYAGPGAVGPHGGAQQPGAPSPIPAGAKQPSIPATIGKVVQALILIVVAIAALRILNIESISAPAEQMLTTIFNAVPNIIGAGIVLAIGVLIARFASDLLGQLLDGLNIDKALHRAEILPEDKSATPAITRVIQVAIVLFFAVMATQLLGFPQVTEFITEVLALGGKVLFGAAIVGAGVFIAGLLARTISGTAGQIVRYATIVLFAAMGLKYMGVADSIIELAFGSLVVGGAVAAALAFGLGGRQVAARQLERLESRGDAKP